MKDMFLIFVTILFTFLKSQAMSPESDGEHKRLITGYHHYQSLDEEAGFANTFGSINHSSDSTSSHEKSFDEDTIQLVPYYRPADEWEKTIDRYVFQPLLFLGGAATATAPLMVINSQNLEAGALPLSLGLGSIAAMLVAKAGFRFSAAFIEGIRYCRRQKFCS